MIEFHDVTKKYDDQQITLDGVNLAIQAGEFVSLVGMSGAGKSTIMKMLTLEEKPSSGTIIVENRDLKSIVHSELPMLRRRIGTIFQDFKLLENRTAYENVAFAMEVCDATQEEIDQDVPKILSIVGLRDKHMHFPSQLSGGEKQRLAIARAMIHRPKILLADEPTGNLDVVNGYDVVQLLLKINELGTTVIMATHDPNIVNKINRRVVTLEKGKIIRDQAQGKYSI